MSLALRRLTGSWGTQFVLGAIAWCLCGVWYTKTLSLTPARELLAAREARLESRALNAWQAA